MTRLPLQLAYETGQNTGKPVTIKFLSKGPNGQLTEQQKVLLLPAHVPAQNVPTQTLPGQIVSNQIVPGQVVNNQIVPGQVVSSQIVAGQVVFNQVTPGQIVSSQNVPGQIAPGQAVMETGVMNGQASITMNGQNFSSTHVPNQNETLSDSSCCTCQSKKGPPPPKRK